MLFDDIQKGSKREGDPEIHEDDLLKQKGYRSASDGDRDTDVFPRQTKMAGPC